MGGRKGQSGQGACIENFSSLFLPSPSLSPCVLNEYPLFPSSPKNLEPKTLLPQGRAGPSWPPRAREAGRGCAGKDRASRAGLGVGRLTSPWQRVLPPSRGNNELPKVQQIGKGPAECQLGLEAGEGGGEVVCRGRGVRPSRQATPSMDAGLRVFPLSQMRPHMLDT